MKGSRSVDHLSVGVLADDLTGALDTAARLTAIAGPIPLLLNPDEAQTRHSVVISSNTRECSQESEAQFKVLSLIRHLKGKSIPFKKIDSLMRGHPIAEIEAILQEGFFDQCFLAPAFPEQRRVTQNGQQWLLDLEGRREAVGPNLVRAFEARGIAASVIGPGATSCDRKAPVLIADAMSYDHLGKILGGLDRRSGRLLYCGTAGLARALAKDRLASFANLPEPIIAVVGSCHPVSLRQVTNVRSQEGRCNHDERIPRDRTIRFEDFLVISGVGEASVLISFDFDSGIGRDAADRRIREALTEVLLCLPRPEALLVTGGETLASMASILRIREIIVEGELEPGIPVSRISGGPWDGISLASKSGAFGDDELLLRMLKNRAGRVSESAR